MRYDEFHALIQARFHWEIPAEYRLMHERGWLTLDRPASQISTKPGDGYLWLNDMEWYELEEIAEFEFPDYCRPHLQGLVPFAYNGAGDYWCWNTLGQSEGHTPILLCPHDYMLATIYAPHFPAALYRQALVYAYWIGWGAHVAEGKAYLHRWATDFTSLMPTAWCKTLESLTSRDLVEVVERRQGLQTLLPNEERQAIEARDLNFADLDKEVCWSNIPAPK
jgi:hypothetical protein